MTRVLLASFTGIAALFGGSILAIAWSTSSERPYVSAPETDAAPLAVAQVSLPSSTSAPPRATPLPAVVAAATPVAAAPSPSALAERARAESASLRRPVGGSDGRPGASRLVVSARDRHLSLAHPEILAQPRITAAEPARAIEDPTPALDAPCDAGSGCDAGNEVDGMAAPAPPDGVEDEVPVSQ